MSNLLCGDAQYQTGISITHLHTLPPGEPVSVTPVNSAPQDFRQLLQNLVKRPGKPQ